MPEPDTTQSEPIRLEMSKRSKLSCTLLVASGILLIVVACMIARAKGARDAASNIAHLYTSVAKAQYAEIGGFITPSVELTLKTAATYNGQISSFKVMKVEPGLTGRPTTVYMLVTRNGKEYVDVVGTLDNMRMAVVEEYPKEDFDNHRNDRVIREFAK